MLEISGGRGKLSLTRFTRKEPNLRDCCPLPIVLSSSLVCVPLPKILTPWRESPAPDKESFLTFWLTRDAVVHVCMDSRTPPGKLPPWLQYAGFRKMPVGTECLFFVFWDVFCPS